MDRRQFLADSLKAAAVAALPLPHALATTPGQPPQQVPGAIAQDEIAHAQFPDGFLWEWRLLHSRWRAHGMKMAKASPFGTAPRTPSAR